MTIECNMAGALMEAWREFAISPEQFRRIAADFALTLEDGLSGRPSPLQMLPGFVGRPCGEETGRYLALDFGGTNLRVAANNCSVTLFPTAADRQRSAGPTSLAGPKKSRCPALPGKTSTPRWPRR